MAGDEGNDPSSFGSKPNVSTCPLIPNIKTALFIQLAATSTVYEDYERNFMPTSSCILHDGLYHTFIDLSRTFYNLF